MKLYRIKDWAANFELRDTSRVDGPLKWIPVPTKTDGLGFGRLRQHKRATDLLAAWYLMLGVAAKQPRQDRGKLIRDGIPLTADDLALMTGFDAEIFTLALSFFCNPASGWMVADDTAEVRTECVPSAVSCGKNGLQESRGEERTVEYILPKPAAPTGAEIEAIWKAYPRKVGKTKACTIIKSLLAKNPPSFAPELLGKVAAYAVAVKSWPAGDERYIPHPATWFSQGRYDDDPATWLRNGSTRTRTESKSELAHLI